MDLDSTAVHGSEVGVLVLDASRSPLAFNREALRVLAFPGNPARIPDVNAFLHHKINNELHGCLEKGEARSEWVHEFRSGRRRYLCTATSLQQPAARRGSVVLLFERPSRSSVDVDRVGERYNLTQRERELVRHVLLGLTTREIAARMSVSTSTVNSFLHLVKAKTGANRRSGIIRKILSDEPAS